MHTRLKSDLEAQSKSRIAANDHVPSGGRFGSPTCTTPFPAAGHEMVIGTWIWSDSRSSSPPSCLRKPATAAAKETAMIKKKPAIRKRMNTSSCDSHLAKLHDPEKFRAGSVSY